MNEPFGALFIHHEACDAENKVGGNAFRVRSLNFCFVLRLKIIS
jgi:hypothetical protein